MPFEQISSDSQHRSPHSFWSSAQLETEPLIQTPFWHFSSALQHLLPHTTGVSPEHCVWQTSAIGHVTPSRWTQLPDPSLTAHATQEPPAGILQPTRPTRYVFPFSSVSQQHPLPEQLGCTSAIEPCGPNHKTNVPVVLDVWATACLMNGLFKKRS